MSHLSPELKQYLERLVPPRTPELQAMEDYGRNTGFPIVGPVSGQFCYLVARILGARRVFELGSGYGYSTAWFARAVQENGGGVVYHVVWNEGLSREAHAHLDGLGYGDIVQYRVSEAVQALRETDGPFDLIFNDIEKAEYPTSLPVIHEKLRPGGVLLVDNALWHGRIFDPNDRTPDTSGVRELTKRITQDPDWTASLLPIGDGLLVAYRR